MDVREVHVRAVREVPLREHERARASRGWRSATARGSRCSVEVKPRKSSASGGIRSAPGTPAATASLLGRPPPAKPRRTVVRSRGRRGPRRAASRPSAIASRLSLRISTATSFCLELGVSLDRSRSGRRRGVPACRARRSTGCSRSHCAGTWLPEVGQAPGEGDTEPGRRRRVAGLELGEGILRVARALSPARPSPRLRSRRRGAAAARAPRRRCP